MRKIFFIFCMLLLPTDAHGNLPTSTKATKENLLEDATIDLLQPQMYSAVDKYYGTRFEIAFMCQKINEIKKLDHPGSWYFEVELEGVTYTGPHTPLDIFKVTVEKSDYTEGKWVMKNYEVRKFNPEEKYECREPA